MTIKDKLPAPKREPNKSNRKRPGEDSPRKHVTVSQFESFAHEIRESLREITAVINARIDDIRKEMDGMMGVRVAPKAKAVEEPHSATDKIPPSRNSLLRLVQLKTEFMNRTGGNCPNERIMLEKAFVGADLRGMDLSDLDLSGINLEGANLSGCDFTGSTTWRTNFRRADLRNAKLHFKSVSSSDMQFADLRGASAPGFEMWCTQVALEKAILDHDKNGIWIAAVEKSRRTRPCVPGH